MYLDLGLYFRRLHIANNACFVSIAKLDTTYGASNVSDNAPWDATAITPDRLSDGTLFASFFWETTNGRFFIAFGENSDQMLVNATNIIISSINGKNLLLQWDSVETAYITTNQELADQLAAQYDANGELNDMCFGLYPLVTTVIRYNSFEVCDCDTCMLPDFAIYYDNYTINCWSK